MSTLYLTEQGLVLSKTQHRLVISKNGKTIKEIPIFQVERIVIFGNIQISTQALDLILDSGIECSFLTSKGKFRGVLRPVEQGNVFLRIAQYERYLDESFRCEFSKEIVKGKIINQLNEIKRFAKNHPEISLEQKINDLDRILKTIREENSINALLGIEGYSTSVYFSTFKKMIKKEFEFNERTRRPPKDPVNALLSLGYTLITNEIFSLLCASGFDPYIGYYHDLVYNRPSLALDIVEEFRTPIVDRLVLNLINHHMISLDDFEQKEDSDGIYLRNEARKMFFAEYEKIMTQIFVHKKAKTETNFRNILKEQVYLLLRVIQENELYKPFIME